MADGLAKLAAHAETVDFAAISEADAGRWIDALPLDEFVALIDAHGRWSTTGEPVSIDGELPAVSPLEPHGDDWAPCDEQPVGDDDLVWIMYLDGETGGPNLASAFLWGADQGSASIIAYALAVPGTPVPSPTS